MRSPRLRRPSRLRLAATALAAILAPAVATVALALSAASSQEAETAAPAIERGAPVLGPRALDPAAQAALSASPRFTDFAARHGTFWVEWDESNALPRRALGNGIPLGRAPFDADDATEMALAFLESEPELFLGLSRDDLRLVHSVLGGRLYYVVFEQMHRGVPIEESRVEFRINTDGVLSLFGESDACPGLSIPSDPVLTEDAALAAALAVIPAGEGPAEPPVLGQNGVSATLVVAPPRLGRGNGARLAYRVHVPALERPHDFFVLVDAADGTVLRIRDEVYEVDVVGNADGRAVRFSPCTTNPLDILALPNLRVAVRGGNFAFSDATGAFRITHGGSAPVTVDADLSGRWANVNNQAGSDVTFSASATPGTPLAIRFNPSGTTEFLVSQVNGYYHTNFIHDWLKQRLPGAAAIDQQVPCNVNINSSCNAYYTGGTINFYRQAGGCVNTCFDTVVYHEYGHYVDARIGGILDGGLSEGWGDILAIYATGQPIVGECWRGVGTYIRTGDNNRRWPASECGGQVHCVGESWAGFAWHLRQNLIASLGAAQGADVADQDVLNVLFAGSGNIADAVIEVFAQDDDDGDFTNGTPNFNAIRDAANRHSFPVPAPPTISTVSPEEGPLYGGTEVVITGQNFLPGSQQVTFGGVPGQIREATGTTRLVVAPPKRSLAGVVNLVVSTPFGAATRSFEYRNRIDIFFPETGALYVGETKRVAASGLEANGDWILAVSLQTRGSTISGIPFTIGPPFVLVDSVGGPAAPLDSYGYGEVMVRVPRKSSLSFKTIYFQSAVEVGGGFSNSAPWVATIFPQRQ